VCFKEPEHAEAAVTEMNKKQIAGGQFLIVNKHVSKKDNELVHGQKINPITQNLSSTFNSNIYVKFIPNDVSEEELRKTFTVKDSKIVSLKLTQCVKKIEGVDIRPYQYAYILYDTVQAAQKAIQTYDGSYVFGPRPILVEMWVSKEEKEQEKKRKESQTINQFLSNIVNITKN
jgi:RNA recognition motif-containing protein